MNNGTDEGRTSATDRDAITRASHRVPSHIIMNARLRIEEFLRIVRDEPAQPMKIEIVNAREIGATEKVLRVVRDDTGKMTGP